MRGPPPSKHAGGHATKPAATIAQQRKKKNKAVRKARRIQRKKS